MRIFNFYESLLCYSTKKETCRCSLRWESGLTSVGYTGKFGIPGVAYAGVYRSSMWPTRAGHRSSENDSMNRQCRFLP
jgi:hypothetical protein